MSAPVDSARLTAEVFDNPLEFETLLAKFLSRFINLPSAEVEGEIENALGRVCELVGIDLAVLWQWSAAAPALRLTPALSMASA